MAKGLRIQARQLPYGQPKDATALRRPLPDGTLLIPESVLEKPLGACSPHVELEATTPTRVD